MPPQVALTATATVATPRTRTKLVFTRTGDTSASLAVAYKVAGTAVGGTDYQPLGSTLTIPAGAASTRVKLKVLPGVQPAATLQIRLVASPAYQKAAGSRRIVLRLEP